MAAFKELITSGLVCAVYLVALTTVLCFVDFSSERGRPHKDSEAPRPSEGPDPVNQPDSVHGQS
jgi:hypothetical protein